MPLKICNGEQIKGFTFFIDLIMIESGRQLTDFLKLRGKE